MSNITVGFDVSLYRTGVAVLDDGHLYYTDVIEVQKGQRVDQLYYISYTARHLLSKYRPTLIAIETAAKWQRDGHDRTQTIIALAEARAAILVATARYRQLASPFGEVRIVEMGVHEVRELLCSNRTASKEQVQASLTARGFCLPTRIVRERLGAESGKRNGRTVLAGGWYEPREVVDADIADAIAVAKAVEMTDNWERFTKERRK